MLKAPFHYRWMDVFLKVFPDACVIQTHCDPSRALPSCCSLSANHDRDRVLKFLDLEQMLWLDGKIRTREEWQELVEASGFEIQQTVQTSVVDIAIIEISEKV